ncbi:MacB family efflux pump subunit [Nitrobacter sp.]|uniref:MacB family efflux pump subunit n=1 Tax=Nitrobacter sp. TaxID=29420 RepID=UPI003F64CA6B
MSSLSASAPPLIELTDLRKTYMSDETVAVEVLRGISLSIRAGEFVAIMGQSGSGKSTLMNVLGLLDKPTGGTYRFAGHDVAGLSRDELARLRRDAFGFVFQQYNLIPTVTAVENVEIPATYAGLARNIRHARAADLLARLGLADRVDHRPNQLSGGQQQRVSIARALMNGGSVILADEPTGALDSTTGAEVMALLAELAKEGHTVILITHDREVAGAAHRIVEIRDGMIMSDTGNGMSATPLGIEGDRDRDDGASIVSDMREALHAGGRALASNPFRTALTLLGIVIGVASVIALLAIGEGAKEKVLAQLSIYGANRMYVIPGGESSRGPGGRLLASDADIVRGVPNVAAAMPYLEGKVIVRAGNVDYPTSGVAITTDFPRILHWSVEHGVFFTRQDERSLATVAVIGSKLAARMFPDGSDPVRRTILVNNVPFQVIGVLSSKGALSGDSDDDDTIVFPFSTGSVRVFGKQELSWVSVLVDDLSRSEETATAITSTLEAAHRVRDFRVFNKAASIQAQDRTQNTLTLLLGFTAAISLLVGGIGVMNVMLMTVTERTREIGIRMATGARTADILRQFLTEAMMVSGVGGLAGACVGLLAGVGAAVIFEMPVIFSLVAVLGAVICAVLTGLVFGFMPALRAARLEPVAALARE